MNIVFEKGREHSMDTVGTEPVSKVIEPTEKELLQAKLVEAGVEFNKTLGVAKLQALVDELPEA